MAQDSAVGLEAVAFDSIAGWKDDDHAQALAAFRRSCDEILNEGRAFRRDVRFGGRREHWLDICESAKATTDARRFFETGFTAFLVSDPALPDGLFTGYYEPVVDGSLQSSLEFPVPVYRPPPDLVAFDASEAAVSGLRYGRISGGKAVGYLTRREIEEGALRGQGLEILWLRDWADAFFIQVQGSGRVRLADGRQMRLSYAMKSGLPYTSIGGRLAERSDISRDEMSMQSIRSWLAGHPQAGRELMWENQSFVFFDAAEAEGDGPTGAQRVPLTAGRSLAVDRSLWMFGTPVWLDTAASQPPLRRLLIAQDTGSAIKGAVRGDVFWGSGERAGQMAGTMKAQGRMIVLLPIPAAEAVLKKQ